MFKPLLLVCMLGTPPTPDNPSCKWIEPVQGHLYETMEECTEVVKALVDQFDRLNNEKGVEAWYHSQKPCSTVKATKS